MGQWSEEQRHGSAVVVTQTGVYFEGTFKDNKMSVSSFLVLFTSFSMCILLLWFSKCSNQD